MPKNIFVCTVIHMVIICLILFIYLKTIIHEDFFLRFLFIHEIHTHTHTHRERGRERERESETQAEGEAGSIQGA